MIEKAASVHWEGQGKKGQGQISTETGALKLYPYGFASRFEDDRRGTTAEPKNSRVEAGSVSGPATTMSHDLVRPAAMTSWFSERDSTDQAANDESLPAASCLACASVEGRDMNRPRRRRSSLNSGVV